MRGVYTEVQKSAAGAADFHIVLKNQENTQIQHSRVIGHGKGQQEPTDCDFAVGWLLCFG